MSITQAKGGKKRLVSDINVTPLVDVMLVLLIIFMITAPMMTQGIDFNLNTEEPATETIVAPRNQKDERLVIFVAQDGQLSLKTPDMNKGTPIKRDQLMRELEKEDKDKPLVIDVARGVRYGLVASLFADARNAGFRKLTPSMGQ